MWLQRYIISLSCWNQPPGLGAVDVFFTRTPNAHSLYFKELLLLFSVLTSYQRCQSFLTPWDLARVVGCHPGREVLWHTTPIPGQHCTCYGVHIIFTQPFCCAGLPGPRHPPLLPSTVYVRVDCVATARVCRFYLPVPICRDPRHDPIRLNAVVSVDNWINWLEVERKPDRTGLWRTHKITVLWYWFLYTSDIREKMIKFVTAYSFEQLAARLFIFTHTNLTQSV